MTTRPRALSHIIDLFSVSFVVLFFELVFIRWIAAFVPFVTFFSNLVLIGSFVGMSLGCLASNHRHDWLPRVPRAMLFLVAVSGVIWILVSSGAFDASVDNHDQIFFGTTWQPQNFRGFLVPVELVLSIIFLLIIFIFAGLGQLIGRLFQKIRNRIYAYSSNIAGSLFGIIFFTFLAYLSLPPFWWFLFGFLPLVFLVFRHVKNRTNRVWITLGVTLAFVFALGRGLTGLETFWSPYYRIDYDKKQGTVTVNFIGHQSMFDRNVKGFAYSLPYLFTKDAGLPAIKDVLVIGAGTGNDMAHALMHGVVNVDAVEIDPVIASIGKKDHPNQPYSDPRVRFHIDDGRAFLAKTEKKYDLIVYALVDSLTLHTSYSSVRLESYLFTEEAFRSVKEHLSPQGIFVAYNYYREGWLVVRINNLLKRVFEDDPLVISIPSKDEISDTEPEGNKHTVLMTGNIGAVRGHFERWKHYTLGVTGTGRDGRVGGFGADAQEISEADSRIFPSQVRVTKQIHLPRDDWPFVYLKEPKIPDQNLRMILIILFLSTLCFAYFKPSGPAGISRHFFFLGAGFMLIETLNVVRLSVLFGSTWVVSSIVFSAILIMALLSNIYCLAVHPKNTLPYYAGLVFFLALGGFADVNVLLALPLTSRIMSSIFLFFTPIFFAGVIFASSFEKSKAPNTDFASNVLGVVLGALLESLTLVTGYRFMIWVIMVCYLLSIKNLRLLRRAKILK
ncbi:MAG: hypothetical protein HY587_01005 [Candidatus Omnitrophica bacterium]|nr:hypothetical protein [Candidatus Omnitrophota bacterium]